MAPQLLTPPGMVAAVRGVTRSGRPRGASGPHRHSCAQAAVGPRAALSPPMECARLKPHPLRTPSPSPHQTAMPPSRESLVYMVSWRWAFAGRRALTRAAGSAPAAATRALPRHVLWLGLPGLCSRRTRLLLAVSLPAARLQHIRVRTVCGGPARGYPVCLVQSPPPLPHPFLPSPCLCPPRHAQAKLAEEAERYDDMVGHVKALAELQVQLNVEVRLRTRGDGEEQGYLCRRV